MVVERGRDVRVQQPRSHGGVVSSSARIAEHRENDGRGEVGCIRKPNDRMEGRVLYQNSIGYLIELPNPNSSG